jgi:hypothetical protein
MTTTGPLAGGSPFSVASSGFGVGLRLGAGALGDAAGLLWPPPQAAALAAIVASASAMAGRHRPRWDRGSTVGLLSR